MNIKDFVFGNENPEFFTAERILSRASDIAVSGRPTTEKLGKPFWTSVSTETSYAVNPIIVAVVTLFTI